MIAFFVRQPDQAAAIAAHFTSVTREVDGPWRLHKGRLQGHDAVCYVVTGEADAAWAALRLAARRGARLFMPITPAFTDETLAEREGFIPGAVMPVGGVWNLHGLLPLLRLLPDSANRLPLELEPLLPAAPVHAAGGEALPAVGTFPFPVHNGAFLRHLDRKGGIPLFDLQLSGYAEGFADIASPGEHRFHPHVVLHAIVTEGGVEYPSTLATAPLFEEMIAGMLTRAN